MIRRSARNDPTAGCVQFEKPLTKAIDEYKAENAHESHQKALQEAYQRGWWDGYAQCDDEHLEASRALDPSSEYAR
jgi:hypothetical protein